MKIITFGKVRHYWKIYFLVLPALTIVALFTYFPAASAIYHAFFRWNGDDVSQFVGLGQFSRAFEDTILHESFVRVMILIAANLVKMIPSIVAAVVIHRILSDKARYIYRVAFVIPMVIPFMVQILIWKYFYDPQVGVLNAILNGTGIMDLLRWMDGAMPWLAHQITPIRVETVDWVFGSPWGLAIFGVLMLSFRGGVKSIYKAWLWWAILLPAALLIYGIAAVPWAGPIEAMGADIGGMGGMLLSSAIKLVLFAVPAAIIAEALRRKGLRGLLALKWIGGVLIAISAVLVVLTMMWNTSTDAFAKDQPAWLGNESLILPSLIIWGFPWVGVVSVLLYLSGLGNIPLDVYEAADIDGCGWFRKFWNIELPLITTQVRLNLVIMCINTLKGWGLIYILLSDTGGPGGAGMVPGLYMFRKAFRDMEAGYASAIGLLLFLLILVLTLINNKYVRVEK